MALRPLTGWACTAVWRTTRWPHAWTTPCTRPRGAAPTWTRTGCGRTHRSSARTSRCAGWPYRAPRSPWRAARRRCPAAGRQPSPAGTAGPRRQPSRATRPPVDARRTAGRGAARDRAGGRGGAVRAGAARRGADAVDADGGGGRRSPAASEAAAGHRDAGTAQPAHHQAPYADRRRRGPAAAGAGDRPRAAVRGVGAAGRRDGVRTRRARAAGRAVAGAIRPGWKAAPWCRWPRCWAGRPADGW